MSAYMYRGNVPDDPEPVEETRQDKVMTAREWAAYQKRNKQASTRYRQWNETIDDRYDPHGRGKS